VFIDALHEAFAEAREPSAKDILEAMTNTVPLAQLMDGQIITLRQWAKGRARHAGTAEISGGHGINKKPSGKSLGTPQRRIAGLPG
jgi:hypothetical protein